MQVSTFPAIPVKLSLATIPSLNHITSPCKACKHVRARGFPLLRPVDLRVPDSPNICHLWSVDRFPRGLKRPLPFPSPNGHRATASMGRRGRVLISSGDCSNPKFWPFSSIQCTEVGNVAEAAPEHHRTDPMDAILSALY